ncbi:MAG: transporter substrate-binding domain-containing protein, partial [Gammaproteobacteria bacterium]|nr:transporter substrate-binding domain-containing protein [Gammaproteobacteria bacterium]
MIRYSIPALFLVLNFTFLVDAYQAYDQSVKVVKLIADEWCPYTCAENHENKGLIVDVAAAAFKEVGLQVSYTSASWGRAIREVERGNHDALLGADAAYLENIYLAKDFLIKEEAVFVFLTGSNITIGRAKDLSKYKIGYMDGYHYGGHGVWQENIRNHSNAIPLSGAYGEVRLLNLLMNKRIDIAVMNIDVAKHYIHENPAIEGISFIRKDITSNLHIGFSPNARGKYL